MVRAKAWVRVKAWVRAKPWVRVKAWVRAKAWVRVRLGLGLWPGSGLGPECDTAREGGVIFQPCWFLPGANFLYFTAPLDQAKGGRG